MVAHTTKVVAFEGVGRDLSIDASLGIDTLPPSCRENQLRKLSVCVIVLVIRHRGRSSTCILLSDPEGGEQRTVAGDNRFPPRARKIETSPLRQAQSVVEQWE